MPRRVDNRRPASARRAAQSGGKAGCNPPCVIYWTPAAQDEGLNEAAIGAFKHNLGVLTSGANLMIPESNIKPVDSLPSYDDLSEEDPSLLTSTDDTEPLLLWSGDAVANSRCRALKALPHVAEHSLHSVQDLTHIHRSGHLGSLHRN